MRHNRAGAAAWPLVSLALAVASGVGACTKDEGPSRCRYLEPPIARTPLTATADGRLLRAGEGFVLVGVEPGLARWATLSRAGQLGFESSTALPTAVAGPFLATVGNPGAPSLLVVWMAAKASGAGHEVLVATQTEGGVLGTPVVAFDVPSAVAAADVRLAVGGSADGSSAAIALGFDGQPGAPISVRVVGPGAALVGGPTTVTRNIPESWRCLAVSPAQSTFALTLFGVRSSGARTPFRIYELDAAGVNTRTLEIAYDVPEMPSCPVVAATARGYGLAWQTPQGTTVSDYDIALQSAPSEFALGSVRWGGVDKQPALAGVSMMGPDLAVAYASSPAPQVFVFDYEGTKLGGALVLPGAGPRTGPVASASGRNELWLTYADVDASGAATTRHLVKVDCELRNDRPPPDAGADGGL